MLDWSPEEDLRMKELRETHTQEETAAILTEEFKTNRTRNSVSNREALLREHEEKKQGEGYKETVEILQDGTHKSDKLLRMSAEQSKDQTYLLKAHGYDGSWEITSAKSSIWNQHNKQDGTLTLYASKITVKPKVNGFDIDKLIKAIKEVQPITVETNIEPIQDKRMLEIPLFDAHFGISDYEYYKPTQSKIIALLVSKRWEETLFIIGQDNFHNDNFRGQTANGTQIETVDMVKAWNDSLTFYSPMIEKALQQSKRVKVIYSKGNHDETLSWAFIQLLKAKYPQVTFDDAFVERKVHVFGYNFIGVTHGDKARKNLHNIFPIEYPLEWSRAKSREIHIGHFHVEDGKDIFGMMVRTLATRNKTDQWHKDNGFVGAHKRFMLFEYSESELEAIYYV